MENSSNEQGEMIEQPLLVVDDSETQKGGFRTLPFILGNAVLMNAATYALTPNMILYLMNEYHMDMTTASNIIYIWSAVTNIAPVVGAFMADSFVGRFQMIGLGSVVTFVGMFLFWLTSVIPQARPPPCIDSNTICRSADMFQLFFLCFSLGIVAIGSGAVKSSSLAFGSDQLKREVYQENARAMERYFSWFLNKACIVQDPQLDLTPDGEATDPWRLCTVDQVEELKALLKVVPIWLTGVVLFINMSQNSFPVLQANTMDRHIGSSFEIPAASFGIFAVISAILWIVLYDCLILPIASKLTGKPARFSTKERMGFGLFLSFLSVLVMAVVEGVRRSIAIKEGYSDDPEAVIPMSAVWLLPQNFLTGFAEALYAIGQNEFYISEFPRSMSSVAASLVGVGMGMGSLLASFLMNTIDDLTKREGHESWISSNVNKGHYDYYYLVLAGFSLVNILCYIVCSRAYGPCKGDEGEVMEEEKP